MRVGPVSLPYEQSKSMVSNLLKKELIYSQPSTLPSWSSTLSITINETNCIIHKNILCFTLGSVNNAAVSLCPASYFINRCVIESRGGIVMQTLNKKQWIVKQTKYTDFERQFINVGEGPYNNVAVRQAIANQQSQYFIVLEDLFLMTQDYLCANQVHQPTFKIDLASLSSILCGAAGINNITCPILSVTLISEISRSSDNFAPRIERMKMCSEVSCFSDSKIFTGQINPGSSSTSIVLALTQNITHLLFTVQASATADANESNFSNFLPVLSYSLLNSKNETLINKSSNIDGKLYLFYISRSMNDSTLTVSGDSSQFVYGVSLSSDLKSALRTGSLMGSYPTTSLESLVVNLAAPATAALSVSVVVFYEQLLTQSVNSSNIVTTTFYKK